MSGTKWISRLLICVLFCMAVLTSVSCAAAEETITVQSQSVMVPDGETASVSVKATGTGLSTSGTVSPLLSFPSPRRT